VVIFWDRRKNMNLKQFILSAGETLLGIFVIIGLIVAVISMFNGGAGGVILALSILVIVVSVTFLLYLLIDIRDKSIETNKLLKKILEKNNNE